jgi:hypothetical protein
MTGAPSVMTGADTARPGPARATLPNRAAGQVYLP